MADIRGLEEGMRVIVSPRDKTERLTKGVIVKLGPQRSRVRVPGSDKPLGYWNFELAPALDMHA